MSSTRFRIGATLALALGFAGFFGFVPAPAADDPPAARVDAKADAATVAAREAVLAFTKGFNAHDPAALGSLFLNEAELVGADGATTRGREDITAMFAASFEQLPQLAIAAEVVSVRPLTADVVRAEGTSRLSGGSGGEGAPQHTNFDALLVRRDGVWRFAELRDTPVPNEDISSYERLRELEWMVGEWVSESEEAKVSSSVKWADNQSFLVRTYRVELPGQKPTTGTMFIGWSPETDQIKSWVFDSEGGHGEGRWTRASDSTWVVKASGTLRDGRPTSATQVHTILGKDSVKTASIDRIIGGEIATDMPEIVMVRKPPAPSSNPTTPSTAPGGRR